VANELLEAAQKPWRRFNGHEFVADMLAGATFNDGSERSPTTEPRRGTRSPPSSQH
jgi:hypothetical protein